MRSPPVPSNDDSLGPCQSLLSPDYSKCPRYSRSFAVSSPVPSQLCSVVLSPSPSSHDSMSNGTPIRGATPGAAAAAVVRALWVHPSWTRRKRLFGRKALLVHKSFTFRSNAHDVTRTRSRPNTCDRLPSGISSWQLPAAFRRGEGKKEKKLAGSKSLHRAETPRGACGVSVVENQKQ